ncbi:MAG TPA: zinc ribbon domain-containing protein [Pyrinomonadaceae bacterium]|jgi:hypothetical protein|nr:zinc ribbon domain-containing protein [Pyrinomonadaceae bacterium]
MYCPQCGQQQIADNTKFCSRCGLPINELAEWLASGGATALRQETAVPLPSPKRKGITRGAKILFFSVMLTPIFLGLSIAADSPGPLFVPLTIFLAGLSVVLYLVFFGEDKPPVRNQSQRKAPQTEGQFSPSALPPASNLWTTNVVGRRLNTAEIVQPPSVTEHTTRLLDDD